MSSEAWRDDTDYDEEVLEALGGVIEDGPERRREVRFKDSGILFAPWPLVDVDFEKGERVRLFGGRYSQVRGMAIGETLIYYKTADEHREEMADEAAKRKKERRAEHEANLPASIERVQKLPDPLQRRVRRFMASSEEWGEQFLEYELSACEQAVVIHEAIPEALVDDDARKAFLALDWAEQKARIPLLDDGHSGNSFAAAFGLAGLLALNPKLLPKMHGAMCGLAGCEEYGCWAASDEAKAERAASDNAAVDLDP